MQIVTYVGINKTTSQPIYATSGRETIHSDYSGKMDYFLQRQANDYATSYFGYCSCRFGNCSDECLCAGSTSTNGGHAYRNGRASGCHSGAVHWPGKHKKRCSPMRLLQWVRVMRLLLLYGPAIAQLRLYDGSTVDLFENTTLSHNRANQPGQLSCAVEPVGRQNHPAIPNAFWVWATPLKLKPHPLRHRYGVPSLP